MRRVLLLWMVLATGLAAQDRSESDPQAVFDKAKADFAANNMQASADGFDRLVELRPDLAAGLWERGIALYYAARYDDCIAQFESHQTVNPNDAENPAWHFLCVARSESPERAQRALLPVGIDSRVPMPEIYELYSGAVTPDVVLAAADGHPPAAFFAHFYVGLHADVLGDRETALEHMRAAVYDDYPRPASFMRTIAVVHLARSESGQ